VPWFDAGARPGRDQVVHDRVLTAANAITFARLAGLPVFVWLVLGPGRLTAAFWTLFVVATTDWIDGYVARRFDQVTKLGRVLDPLIDRALLATAGVTLVLAGFLPWWVLGLIVARDVVLLATAFALFRSIPDIAVTRAGKFATACLLIGVPSFLQAQIDWVGARFLEVAGWGFTAVGIAAYYMVGVQYARLAVALRRRGAKPASLAGEPR
jgi:cardiolipin synthase